MATRRDTLAWLMRAVALSAATVAFSARDAVVPRVGPGYGTDPDLRHPTRPWPLTLDKAQLETVTRLADLILPADERSPAASAVGVPEFLDEWVSAPYPEQFNDRKLVLEGLAWLDQAAGGRFADLSDEAAAKILDSVCDPRTTHDDAKTFFFVRFRRICITGFYTTPEGWADLGYDGNKPSQSWDGPPPEVLARLGI